MFRELARTRRADALKANRPLSPYVFVTTRGSRITSDNATAERVFERGTAALGLTAQGHTIHDCRDTFATIHIETGAGRLPWVSAQLGHKHISTTLNRYTKWVPQESSAGFADDLSYIKGMKAKVEALLRERAEAEQG